jgi:FkbM family methyltransferase
MTSVSDFLTGAVHRSDARRAKGAALLTLARLALGEGHLTVVDIGARGHLHPLFEPVAPVTRVVGFEPDPAEAARLRSDARAPWLDVTVAEGAVTGYTGPRRLYLTRRRDLSSLLAPTTMGSRDWQVEEVREIDGRSVSDWLADGCFPAECDYLKIDAQGAEYEILASLPDEVWSHLSAIEVECRFLQHYHGQRHVIDVLTLVRDRGFEVAALHPVYQGGQSVDRSDDGPPTRRTLSHCDALCVRPLSWPGEALVRDRDHAAAALLLSYAVHGYWQQGRRVAHMYLPEILPAVDACLPRREHPLRWRVAVLARTLRLLARPSRSGRFDLAEAALRIDGAGSTWRLSAPKL